jgi:chromosome segregation ATPase
LAQIREAAYSPTPLTEFLRDPLVIGKLTRAHSRSRTKYRRGSSSPHHCEHSESSPLRDHQRDGQEYTNRQMDKEASLMSLVLEESERQAAHLRSLLRVAGDKLSTEMHHAAQAQRHAQQAGARETDTLARLTAAEAARHQAERDALKWKEDFERCEQAVESAERELRRAKADMRTLERQRYEAEEEASRNRDEAMKHQFALRDHQAREEGKEQGHRLAIQKWFDEGKDEGWEVGHEEGHEEGFAEGRNRGYKEGFKAGRDQGFQSGREHGQEEERRNALDAFDKFLAEEMHGHTEKVSSTYLEGDC